MIESNHGLVDQYLLINAKEIKSKSKVYLMALNAGLGSFYFGYN